MDGRVGLLLASVQTILLGCAHLPPGNQLAAQARVAALTPASQEEPRAQAKVEIALLPDGDSILRIPPHGQRFAFQPIPTDVRAVFELIPTEAWCSTGLVCPDSLPRTSQQIPDDLWRLAGASARDRSGPKTGVEK